MIQKRNDNNFMIGAAIFIIIIIIISGVYFIYWTGPVESNKKPVPEKIIVDDQISPEVNQALIVEINRIRSRDIIDAVMTRGSAWDNPPAFYYEVKRDDNTFISKDVSAAGGASNEQLFVTWDTMLDDYQQNRIQEDIAEEQPTVDVEITIKERESSGLLGLKTQDVVKETIDMTYNFRTGRWTGDDYFMDDDGYGHYVGDNYEVWFKIYQTDYDHDGIPYWTEVNVLHTHPKIDDSMNDPDHDGIPTSWEWKWGYDPFTWDDHEHLDPDIDGIENIEEYQIEQYFSDPYKQDIYLEVDGMQKGGFLDPAHVFHDASSEIMIERFAQHGINLYIDNGWPNSKTNGGGELVPHYDVVSQDSGIMLQFYRNNFDDSRKGIFRYVVVGHDAGFCIPSQYNQYDTIVIDSSLNKIYFKRGAFTPRTQRIVLAAAAMHELGHSLGIAPWTFQGNDNLTFVNGRAAKQEYIDKWGDYYSVMNYLYIWDKSLADYSDGSNGPPYDQDDWKNFYLPTFEVDVNAVEDPTIEPPALDRLINETVEPTWTDWVYDENLTTEYKSVLSEKYYIENIDKVEVRAYIPANFDEKMGINETVKIFAKPDCDHSYSQWSLIAEGMLNKDNELTFYSQQEIIDQLMEFI